MIIATHKCGCPAPLTTKKPDCSPCCKHPALTQRSTRNEMKNFEAPSCCPGSQTASSLAKHDDVDNGVSSGNKLVSGIIRNGLPYKQIEAIINNNRVVMRLQNEAIEEQYDPPCDCVADPGIRSNCPMDTIDSNQEGASNTDECRTAVLYPQPNQNNNANVYGPLVNEPDKKHRRETVERPPMPRQIEQEENPNIFLLRIRRNCDNGERKHNIDVEFRTARPWSRKRRIEEAKMWKPTKLQQDLSSKTVEGKDYHRGEHKILLKRQKQQ